MLLFFFFFQAEDGIRDKLVTGVQTCALPICVGGIVLALEDVTRFVGQELQRRHLLQALAAGVRAPTANIRATAENMVSFPEMDAAQRQRFAQIIAEESLALSRTINEALSEYADAIKASMALEDMRAAG